MSKLSSGTKTLVVTRDQAHAIKAFKAGTASPEQQAIAFDWIVYQASGLMMSQFIDGSDEGRRGTDFMTGRAFPGQQLLAVAMSPMDALFPQLTTKDQK